MKIDVQNIYKVFGKRPQQQLQHIVAGVDKPALLEKTGHVLGLDDISLSIESSEVFVIMGLSGSGKSTLIRLFNRLIEPTAGRILIDGEDVTAMNPQQLERFRRHKVSMVFQGFGLFPHKTVLENIGYGLQVQGVKQTHWEDTAHIWLERVGLKGVDQQYPHQLSGGMRQRVGLARALCTDADILLMDEAFSALDPLIRREMQTLLLSLQQELCKTIVFITHDLDEALRLGDRIAILNEGRLVQQGTADDILLRPADAYVEAFVKNVNRARALTAADAIQVPEHVVSSDTPPGELLSQLNKLQQDHIPVLEQGRLVGLLTAYEARMAVDDKADSVFPDYLSPVEVISAEISLRDLLTRLVNKNAEPLAVADERGAFLGWVSRERVVELVA